MRFHPLLLLAALLVACAGGIDPSTNADDKTDDVDDTTADAGPTPDAPPPMPMPDAGPAGPVEILTDADLDVTPLEGESVYDACQARAPWGSSSWGIQAFTTSDPARPRLGESYFDVDDGQIYMYGQEREGRLGLVRLIQGDIWGSTACAPRVPWHVFTPVAVGGKQVKVSVNVVPFKGSPLKVDDNMVKMAVNLWFSSPDMPAAGGDRNLKKPLVLDLVFRVECTSYDACQLAETKTAELQTAYHYGKQVTDAPLLEESVLELDVSAALADAVREFKLEGAASSLKLYQAEVVVTMKNTGADLGVDHFGITVR